MEALSGEETRRAAQLALAEDVGSGDITALGTIAATATAKAVMLAREPLVVAGLPLGEAVFRELASGIRITREANDGEQIKAGQSLLQISGSARAILTAERVALNFMQRLSGIATLTSLFVDAIKGTRAQILDTRKTTPGLRRLEKYAVHCGGGTNHRLGLDDGVLIKDNHLRLAESLGAAVELAKGSGVEVEVECESLEQVREALGAGADWILLDNMAPARLEEAVALAAGRARLEASGGITLDNVRAVAETGVDFISIGALTHSARALDVSMEVL